MIFFLKTQAGWRETDRHEVVAGPTINVIDGLEDAERFTRRIEPLAKRQAVEAGSKEPFQRLVGLLDGGTEDGGTDE